jgi:hypothetical protein
MLSGEAVNGKQRGKKISDGRNFYSAFVRYSFSGFLDYCNIIKNRAGNFQDSTDNFPQGD